MNGHPKVSIAINNYNYARFLPEAIDSALNQTYPNVEVIVVDDGSTDNSREIIASYGDKIISVLKQNGGQASAFNAGFAASSGDIICFLDADDRFMPDKAIAVVEALRDRSDLGWCFHPLQWVDSEGKPLTPPKDSLGEAQEYDLRSHLQKTGKLRDKLSNLPSTTGLCFTRSLLQKILPMPEAKNIGLNDGYLEFSAIGLSKGIILNQELAQYRVHGSNAYAQKPDKQKVQARIIILTAYWMKQHYPELSQFTNNLLGSGLGMYTRSGGKEPECQELIKNYLALTTFPERMQIYARATYNYLKNTKY